MREDSEPQEMTELRARERILQTAETWELEGLRRMSFAFEEELFG